MTPAIHKLALDLAASVLALEAILSEGAVQTDFPVMALRKRVSILAADLKEALTAPVKVQPWSPWNQRETSE